MFTIEGVLSKRVVSLEDLDVVAFILDGVLDKDVLPYATPQLPLQINTSQHGGT